MPLRTSQKFNLQIITHHDYTDRKIVYCITLELYFVIVGRSFIKLATYCCSNSLGIVFDLQARYLGAVISH